VARRSLFAVLLFAAVAAQHVTGAQTYLICFERGQACMILLTNSDNGELAFRTLLEGIFGDTVAPGEWEGYTPGFIAASAKTAK
jgi:hypothetical protein